MKGFHLSLFFLLEFMKIWLSIFTGYALLIEVFELNFVMYYLTTPTIQFHLIITICLEEVLGWPQTSLQDRFYHVNTIAFSIVYIWTIGQHFHTYSYSQNLILLLLFTPGQYSKAQIFISWVRKYIDWAIK